MPVIFHESNKRRLGNAGKDRPYSRIPPKPVWPGLDHNGKPVDDDGVAQGMPPVDDGSKDQPRAVPAFRSRKRKKAIPEVWKEIMTVSEEQLPVDLQAGDSPNDYHKEAEAAKIPNETSLTLNCQDGDPSPLQRATPAVPIALPATDPSPSESSPVLQCIPDIISGLAELHSKLDNLLSVHTTLSDKQDEHSQSLKQHDAILCRIEALLSRQESQHTQRVYSLQKRIHELEQDAHQRDMIILDLHKSQKQERRESHNRMVEALQKIEHLQTQNEKMLRQTLSMQEQALVPRKVGDSNFMHDVNVKKRRLHSANSIGDSTETSEGHETSVKQDPKRGPLLNDSPSSIGSFSSTRAVSRRERIIPGRSLLRSTDSRRLPSIRDLIPNYSLDSLAKGRSHSSLS